MSFYEKGKKLVIAVDFDGTCVTHDYPEVGRDIGAVPILRKLVDSGHNLILYTMRSAQGLREAIDWFADSKVVLYGVHYNPTQSQWTSSNKCYAHIYIDDAALGCPLIHPSDGKRPYVDWEEVDKQLKERGLYE